MEIKPIKTESDYEVEAYEMKHFPIAPPDPIDVSKCRMAQMGMTKTDRAKYLGSQSRVSEVLG